MRARLIALAATTILFVSFIQPGWASIDKESPSTLFNDLDLPSALAEDDSFDDLPFEQLRQALREEVEQGPKKGLSPRSSKRYNFLKKYPSRRRYIEDNATLFE